MTKRQPDCFSCPHEQDVLDAIAAGRWPVLPALSEHMQIEGREHVRVEGSDARFVGVEGPDRAEDDLRRHVAQCQICRDLAAVVTAIGEDHHDAWREAPVLSADVVWFRAQLRARAEAARIAARPVAIVQAIGLACAIGALAGFLGGAAWWLRSWINWLSMAAAVVADGPGGMDVLGLAARGILLALGVWLVLAPVAVYLAATDD